MRIPSKLVCTKTDYCSSAFRWFEKQWRYSYRVIKQKLNKCKILGLRYSNRPVIVGKKGAKNVKKIYQSLNQGPSNPTFTSLTTEPLPSWLFTLLIF